MSVDSIGDFLTAIRNALMVSKKVVVVPFSNVRFGIAKVLKDEGYIKDFVKEKLENNKANLKIYLKYFNGESIIHELKRISKPSRRRYENIRKMTKVVGGLGVSILSTNIGIITDQQAREKSVGGEVLCHVW